MLQKITLVHRSVGYSLFIICLYSKVKGMTAQGLLNKIVSTYYIHIITHIKQFFKSILNMIKYVKMTITDHFAMLLLQNCLPLSLFCISLYLSPRRHSFIPLLSCPRLSLLHLLVTLVKAASMKVMDLNQQPIVSLCK